MTRADRLTLVRQLREEGLSQRAIAKRLKVSKDTVRRDVERLDAEPAPDDAPPAEPGSVDAPQVGAAAAEESAPDDAPQGAPVAQLPRRLAQPLAGIDVSKWRAVRRDLAVLAQTGRTPEELVHQAVTALAHHYAKALAGGQLPAGQPFFVRAMQLTPLPVPAARSTPAEPVAERA